MSESNEIESLKNEMNRIKLWLYLITVASIPDVLTFVTSL